MACHLFLGGDREQLFEEQTLPEQPNTSSCVRLAPSPELSPCSCGRQGRNGGRRQQNLPPTQGLELFICLTRTDTTQPSLELLLPWRGAATGMAQQSPRICCHYHHSRGWDIPEVTQKSGIWHMLQSLNHLTVDTLSGTVQAYCQSSICCQQNRLIQYFGLHREEKHRKA